MSRRESGRTGRIVYARVRPNEDLVQTIEKLCLEHGFEAAIVRGSLGSLSQASFDVGGAVPIEVPGPAVEILSLVGEVRADEAGAPRASVSGTATGPDGRIHAGRLVSGRNPVCITFEIVLEEWVADRRASA